MRRLWPPLLIAVLLAACSSVPEQVSRSSGSTTTASNAYRTRPPGFPNFIDHSVGREEISIQAMGLVGVPYRWGGNTPDSGFDCSGLVKYVVARAASVNLPRTTAEMSLRGEPVEPEDIAAGDLVFFNTTGRPHSHVGIYVGKLRFVDAPSTGGTVRLDYLTNPYWARHFDGIRRVAPPKQPPTQFDTPTWEASAPAQQSPADTAAPIATVTTVAAPAPTPIPAESGREPATRAVAADSMPPTNTAAVAAGPAPVAAATPADAFEPPPPTSGAAQIQARAAGAVSPAVVRAAPAADQTAAVPTQATASTPPPPSPSATAPDPIDAAADAFEPPPPAAVAERQAAAAHQVPVAQQPAEPLAEPPAEEPANAPVRILRASTAAPAIPAPTQSSDDPIARFANGGY